MRGNPLAMIEENSAKVRVYSTIFAYVTLSTWSHVNLVHGISLVTCGPTSLRYASVLALCLHYPCVSK
jgi:hypothetical protein